MLCPRGDTGRKWVQLKETRQDAHSPNRALRSPSFLAFGRVGADALLPWEQALPQWPEHTGMSRTKPGGRLSLTSSEGVSGIPVGTGFSWCHTQSSESEVGDGTGLGGNWRSREGLDSSGGRDMASRQTPRGSNAWRTLHSWGTRSTSCRPGGRNTLFSREIWLCTPSVQSSLDTMK